MCKHSQQFNYLNIAVFCGEKTNFSVTFDSFACWSALAESANTCCNVFMQT